MWQPMWSGKTGGFAQYTTAKPGETYGSAFGPNRSTALKEYGDVNLSAGQQKITHTKSINQAISQAIMTEHMTMRHIGIY